MAEWTVLIEPVREEVRGGRSGIRVALTDGERTREVSRVAFVRRHAKEKEAREVEFETALQAEIEKAERAAEIINEFLAERERAAELAAEKALEDAQARLTELLGPNRQRAMV